MTTREQYEDWFRGYYNQEPMPELGAPAHDFCWAGYIAGAASRDAEIAELRYRIELYEKALILSWPNGATGHAFDYWNSARKQDNDRS